MDLEYSKQIGFTCDQDESSLAECGGYDIHMMNNYGHFASNDILSMHLILIPLISCRRKIDGLLILWFMWNMQIKINFHDTVYLIEKVVWIHRYFYQ